ncbi:MAG: hypothetical protein FWC51_03020 [Proteobacteria bacterium]|nr:hypothetical protein [Pseudomonadota bacterium]
MSAKRLKFGKRIEYLVISKLLAKDFDCYVPIVDDHGVDVVVRKGDGTLISIQIKATDGRGDFPAIKCNETLKDYWLVFYSTTTDKTWIMTLQEWKDHSRPLNQEKFPGERGINFATNKDLAIYEDPEFGRLK